MFAEFKHSLRRLSGRVIGWSIGLFLYSLMMVLFFDILVIEMPGYVDMIEAFPPEIMALFGSLHAIMTPAGYMDIYFFSYATIIIGIFVIGAAVGMLAGDEERGVLDLILAHPISRSGLFASRTLALVAATLIILLVCWLSWAIPGSQTQHMNLTWLEFLLPFVTLLVQLLLFSALALLLSLVLPSARLAGMLTGAFLVGNFLFMGLYRLNDDLGAIARLTPLYYYQGGMAVDGLEWGWLAGILAVTLLLTAIAWLLFQRRDIRVGGEGSWRILRR